MVIFEQLATVDPGRWMPVAAGFRALADAIADRVTEIDQVIAALGTAWAGSAASAAIAQLESWRASLLALFPAIVGVDQALSEFADAVRRAQAALHQVAAPPADPSLWMIGPMAYAEPLGAADRADRVAAARIDTTDLAGASGSAADPAGAGSSGLGAGSAAPPATAEMAAIPAIGAGPAVVAAWWAALRSEQQLSLITQRPATIDSLDGVPADARDQAARMLLHEQRAALRADLVTADLRPATRQQISAELAGLDALTARLDAPGQTRAYLLRLDASSDQAIISIGDPDATPDVATFVPGVDSGLATIAPTIAATDNLRSAAGPALATIDWVGYHAPASIVAAADTGPARSAAPDLARFDAGLHVTHREPGLHDTIVGYSYGSTVTGSAARLGDLGGDDIVLVGSPGVGVDTAAQLNVDPTHVWATTAANDAIRLAINPEQTALGALTGHSTGHLWLGTDPTAPAFGARVFASDPGSPAHPIIAHESYFNPNSMALSAIANIATKHR